MNRRNFLAALAAAPVAAFKAAKDGVPFTFINEGGGWKQVEGPLAIHHHGLNADYVYWPRDVSSYLPEMGSSRQALARINRRDDSCE